MKRILNKLLNEEAKEQGYRSSTELLLDYGVIPSVVGAKHSKHKLYFLILRRAVRRASKN